MKKIISSLTLVFLLISIVSCSDHPLPERDPIIVTQYFMEIPTRVAEGRDRYLEWALNFDDLGTVGITEYGIVYSSTDGSSDVSDTPSITDSLSSRSLSSGTIPFSAPIEVDVILTEAHGIPSFSSIYYRAYAKLVGGRVIYGEVFEQHMD